MILIKINQEADYNNEVYDAYRNYRSTQTGAHQGPGSTIYNNVIEIKMAENQLH